MTAAIAGLCLALGRQALAVLADERLTVSTPDAVATAMGLARGGAADAVLDRVGDAGLRAEAHCRLARELPLPEFISRAHLAASRCASPRERFTYHLQLLQSLAVEANPALAPGIRARQAYLGVR